MAGVPQVVRDLLWAVNSRPLCVGPHVAPTLTIGADDIDTEALVRFMQDRGERRVGRYFEHLLLFWFTEIRQLDLVGSGIQLRDGKRTVGEIDFLFNDETGVLTHCEASVKYFLHYPRADSSDFPGPNATDNFERKTQRLFEHQLWASEGHYDGVGQRHAFVKGMIFYREDATRPHDLPERLAPDHQHGRWLSESDLTSLAGPAHTLGALAEKPHWLAAPCHTAGRSIDDLCDQLHAHFGTKRHPVMVFLFDEQGVEAERLFVVSNEWPNPSSGR